VRTSRDPLIGDQAAKSAGLTRPTERNNGRADDLVAAVENLCMVLANMVEAGLILKACNKKGSAEA
jgi:hypothetical protein